MLRALNRRFLFVFFAQLAYLAWRVPSLSTQPHAFAESASHFYRLARDLSPWQNLLCGDAGSLAWPNRLLALLLVKGLGATVSYAGAIQWCTNILLALSLASFSLDACRSFVRDDRLRVAAALILGSGLFFDYDCFTMVNAGYFYLLPALLMALQDKDAWSARGGAARGLVAGLAVSAKAYGLALAPLALWGLARAWRRRSRPEALFHGLLLAFCAAQALSLAVAHAHGQGPPQSPAPPWPRALWDAAVMAGALWRDLLPAWGPVLLWLALLPAALAALTVHSPTLAARRWVLGVAWLGLGSLLLAATQLGDFPRPPLSWDPPWIEASKLRYLLLPHLAAVLLGITALDRLAARPWLRWAILGAWALVLAPQRGLLADSYAYAGGRPIWRWSDTAALLERPRYFVPVDPPGWDLHRGLGMLSVNGAVAQGGRLRLRSGAGPSPVRIWGLIVETDPGQAPLKAWAWDAGRRVEAANYTRRGGPMQYLLWEGGIDASEVRLEGSPHARAWAFGGP